MLLVTSPLVAADHIPVESPAFTASGTFDYSAALERADNPEDLLILGLSAAPQSDPNILTLRWTRSLRGWLPVWALQLVGEAVDGAVELARVAPISGAHYKWTISFDSASGAVSVVVADAATEEVLASQGATLTPYGGQLYLLANGTVDQVRQGYIPLGSSTQVGAVGAAGTFLPVGRFEPHETPWLRVNVPGPTPPGTYRFRVEDEQGTHLSAQDLELVSNDLSNDLLLPLSEALPLGQSRLVVEYVDGDEVLWSQVHALQVGAIAADFGRTERVGPNGPIAASITLQSANDLPPVHVDVRAKLARLEWDQDARSYTAIPYGESDIYSGDVELVANKSVTLPLSFAAPTVPGTYRVAFEPSFTPDVAGHITNVQTHFATYPPVEVEPEEAYTIAILPDTQIYAMHYPLTFFRQAEWLAAQAQELNLALVLHVGDITNDNTPMQWGIAAEAMKLLNHTVPYVLALGNHDYVPVDRPGGGQVYSRDDSLIHEYFSEEDFPAMAGAMVDGRLDNTYHIIDVAGEKYLVVALEFAPSDEAISWADRVIRAHSDHTVIVLTHQYLRADGSPVPSGSTAAYYEVAKDPSTSVNDGTELWQKLLRHHKNIEWVISGHRLTSTIPYRVTRGDHGNPVYQLLADYQGEPEGGGGYLILMSVRPDGTVEIRSYSPYSATFKTDTDYYGFTNQVRIDRNIGQAWVIRPETH